MAISYVSSSAGTTGSTAVTSQTVVAPTGIVAQNLLVAIVYAGNASNTVTFNSATGWTLVAQNSGPSNGLNSMAVYTKTATGSEPANYTFAVSSAAYMCTAVLQYSGTTGLDGSPAFGGNTGSSTTSATIPSVTPTGSGDVWVGCVGNFSGTTASTPTGMTQRVNSINTGNDGITAWDEALTSSSATGTNTSTFASASDYGSVSLLLAPPAPYEGGDAPFHVYAKGVLALGARLANLPSDALKCLLLTSAYNPAGSLATAEYVQDVITAGGVEVASGNGYTTGGVTLSSVSWAATAANSWATSAATSTAYNRGDIVRPSTGNGYLYQCVVAGTSAASAPTWPTVVGTTVVDGAVTWLCIGTAVTALTAGNMEWTYSGTGFSAAYGLVYDSTPGAYTSDPVIGYYDFGGTFSAASGPTLTITVPPSGLLARPSW